MPHGPRNNPEFRRKGPRPARPEPRPPLELPSLAAIEPLAPPADFIEQSAAIGVEFEPGDVERLGRYLAMLLAANEVVNLTAITDPAEAWTRHLLDALTLVPVLASAAADGPAHGTLSATEGNARSPTDPTMPEPPEAGPSLAPRVLKVIDIGSGGGVPAIPLAIVMPDVRFTLVEATGKKVEFLNAAIAALGLSNVQVIQGRAEGIGQDHKQHREHYDAAMARALGHLAIVIELCGPLVRPGGVVLAVKGSKAEQELQEGAKALGVIGLRHVQTIQTPTGRIVVMEKTIRTPRTYPRRDGEPARVPLGVPRERS